MARSDVDAGPYRSRGVPLYANRRARNASNACWEHDCGAQYHYVFDIEHAIPFGPVNRTVFAVFPKDFRRISLKRMMRPHPSR